MGIAIAGKTGSMSLPARAPLALIPPTPDADPVVWFTTSRGQTFAPPPPPTAP